MKAGQSLHVALSQRSVGVSDVASGVAVSTCEDPGEWEAYVDAHPAATIDHRWPWRDVLKHALGHESVYLMARRGTQVVGVLPLVLVRSLLFGRSVVSMPFLNYGGVLADDPAVVTALVEAARSVGGDFKAAHVELRHASRQCPVLPCREHKLSMTLALPPTADELWTALDRKVRNQVRKAQKEQLEVVTGGAELVDEFYAVFCRNMRDLGTPVYPRELFTRTVAAFPDRCRVFVIRHESVPVAAAFGLRSHGTVLNPWASSLREFRTLNPNMLLYWTMLQDAIASGATTFDFGRSTPGAGTHHFKVQWGAVARPLYWEYILLSQTRLPDQGPSNPKFERAIALWQKLPMAIANRLGPMLARHLP